MIVVDSNVLAARNLTGAQTPLAETVELTDSLWIVPSLWRYEFQNILAKGLWARQLTAEGAIHVWRVVMDRMVNNEIDPSAQKIIDLSARHHITAYDANFIALAMEMGVVCVTEDGELQKKFPETAMSMETFVRASQAGSAMHEARAPYRTRKRKHAATP
jgi:predicted nucleic acid-binding protein